MEYVRGIHSAFSIDPDLTLYFDVDAETGASRAGATNKFERAATLESVRENYERLIEADPHRFVRLDATRPPEDVIESTIDVVEAHCFAE